MDGRFKFLFYNTHAAKTRVEFHRHDCHELVYYLKGERYTVIDGIRLKYNPGTFAVICPGCDHDETHISETDVLFIGFTGENNHLFLKNGLFYDDSGKTIGTLLDRMKKEILDKAVHFNLKLDLLVREMLIELVRKEGASNRHTDPFIYIEQFIRENCSRKIDQHKLAELSGYSYHRFRHLFKQKTGFSPVGYIIQRRIDNAKELLKNTDMTIAAIAFDCGFASNSQFCSLFCRITGQTPGAYRKQKTHL